MKFRYLILRKIIKFVATRCQILRLKCTVCTKFNFGWCSAPDPAAEAYSAPPDPLAGFKGGKGKGGGMGREVERVGKGKEGEGRERRGGKERKDGMTNGTREVRGRKRKGRGKKRRGEGRKGRIPQGLVHTPMFEILKNILRH